MLDLVFTQTKRAEIVDGGGEGDGICGGELVRERTELKTEPNGMGWRAISNAQA